MQPVDSLHEAPCGRCKQGCQNEIHEEPEDDSPDTCLRCAAGIEINRDEHNGRQNREAPDLRSGIVHKPAARHAEIDCVGRAKLREIGVAQASRQRERVIAMLLQAAAAEVLRII